MCTYGLVILGVLACFDGFSLAYREENRARYGHVSSGVVVEKFSSTGTRARGASGAGAGATRRVPARSSRARASVSRDAGAGDRERIALSLGDRLPPPMRLDGSAASRAISSTKICGCASGKDSR